MSFGSFVASSPDEKALLGACKEADFVFLGCTLTGAMSVNLQGEMAVFQKLEELEFDSFRKCMSMIVRDPKGQIHVLTKGAESAMLCMCDSGPLADVADAVDVFARRGLRTLVFGHKSVTEDEYKRFSAALETARQSIVNRGKFVRDVYAEIESGMTVVGATGIEDRLQEDVVETIAKVKAAGIIPWMLTGDKKETAINLGQAAGLMPVINAKITI